MSCENVSGDSEVLLDSLYEFSDKPNDQEERTHKAALRHLHLMAAKVKGGVEGKASYSWGGKEPPKFEGSVQGNVEDERGNRGSVGITRDSTGRNRVFTDAEYSNEPRAR